VDNYSVVIKSSAQKELDSLDHAVFRRIDRKILALAENPGPAGCKKLKGYKDQWRIPIGDWRVVYLIDDSAKRVSITHRSPPRSLQQLIGATGVEG
jgi:mRNA interferase RelE/StbE